MSENIDKFTGELEKSIAAGTFVKLTLANYKGGEPQLQKIEARPIRTKKGSRIFFRYKYETRDVSKNYPAGEGVRIVAERLAEGFRNAHLFTTEADVQLDIGKRSSRIRRSKPTFTQTAAEAHDREKHAYVDASAFYLKALGVSTETGEIHAQQQDKWRQINKFVEIVDGLIENSSLSDAKSMRVVDMGSGKGYLTFALYDHLVNSRGVVAEMTGVEARPELVTLCNELAEAGGFDGLRFVQGNIAETDVGKPDILIALHACDTATDDALFKAIEADAKIIVAAPCCHREVRASMSSPDELEGVLKHAVLFDRTAETITDGLRSMLLEDCGYRTKLFEFVPTAHTPKNNMLVATKNKGSETGTAAENVRRLMSRFGIKNQSLADRVLSRFEA